MEREFCHVCGHKLEKKDSRRWFCKTCDQDYYDNPRACADVALFNENDEILLCERAFEPAKGKFEMTGGFIEYDETMEEAALRESEEELGISRDDITALQYVGSYASEYPWGKETYKLVVAVFTAKAKVTLNIKPHDDVASVKWVKIEDIDRGELSNTHIFPCMQQAHKIITQYTKDDKGEN